MNRDEASVKVRIGAAAVASAAWRDGPDAPLVMSLANATAADPGGVNVIALPSASVALARPPLLHAGEIRPQAIAAQGLRLRLHRAADGGIGLDLGQPPRDRAGAVRARLGIARLPPPLQRISLHDSQISVVDEQLDARGCFFPARSIFARQTSGGVEGAADACSRSGDRPQSSS